MQHEPSSQRSHADGRRERLHRVARGGAALVAAVAIGLLTAGEAAAADEIDGLVADTLQATDAGVEPVAEPTTPIVEPALEPVGGLLAPVVQPIAPIALLGPLAGIDPVANRVLPVLEALAPVLDIPMTEAPVPAGADHDPASGITLEALGIAARDSTPILEALRVDEAPSGAPIAAEQAATPTREPVQPFDLPGPISSPPVDAGTTLVAALLIGLAMAIPSGWAANTLAPRLRPIGLTLAPPVPPG